MSEIVALLSTARQAGFDVSTMAGIFSIYFMLKSNQVKMGEQVDKIVKAIQQHNERIDIVEKDIKFIKQKMGE